MENSLILTIALNPSVVRKININNFKIGELNVSKRDELSVGDCGIYSAYVIKVMQGDPYVMGVSGGIGGRFIKNFLDKNRIKTDFLHVDHETKTLMLLEDDENNTLTTISSHNEEISNRDFINIKHKLNHHIDETNIVTISGSDHYTVNLLDEIHKMCKQRKKIILGADGKALKACIEKDVYSVVIDYNDLESLGLEFPENKVSYNALKEFQKKHRIKYIIVKGNYEIVGVTKNKICKVLYNTKDDLYPIVKSMILGGLTIGIKRNYPFEKIMKLIGSIATGCSINEYPFVIKRQEIDRGIKTIKLYEVYNQRNGYLESDKDG
jgi:fructose-1-phosphate kinase PfkB-like protein